MTARKAAIMIAILETLGETDGGPESSLYLALGCNLSDWNAIRDALTAAGWMTTVHHWCAITPAGRALLGEMSAARAAR